MYQFWLNTADEDVVKYLKYFTFLDRAEIEALETATREAPEQREAQRVLAREVTALVHGTSAVYEAEAISRAIVQRRSRVADGDAAGSSVPGHADDRARKGRDRSGSDSWIF